MQLCSHQWYSLYLLAVAARWHSPVESSRARYAGRNNWPCLACEVSSSATCKNKHWPEIHVCTLRPRPDTVLGSGWKWKCTIADRARPDWQVSEMFTSSFVSSSSLPCIYFLFFCVPRYLFFVITTTTTTTEIENRRVWGPGRRNGIPRGCRIEPHSRGYRRVPPVRAAPSRQTEQVFSPLSTV